MDHNKLWKILKEMGVPDHLTCLLRNVYAGQEQQLKPDMEQQTGSKLDKEYVKAVYFHSAYLTYMQSILLNLEEHLNNTSLAAGPDLRQCVHMCPGRSSRVHHLSTPLRNRFN